MANAARRAGVRTTSAGAASRSMASSSTAPRPTSTRGCPARLPPADKPRYGPSIAHANHLGTAEHDAVNGNAVPSAAVGQESDRHPSTRPSASSSSNKDLCGNLDGSTRGTRKSIESGQRHRPRRGARPATIRPHCCREHSWRPESAIDAPATGERGQPGRSPLSLTRRPDACECRATPVQSVWSPVGLRFAGCERPGGKGPVHAVSGDEVLIWSVRVTRSGNPERGARYRRCEAVPTVERSCRSARSWNERGL